MTHGILVESIVKDNAVTLTLTLDVNCSYANRAVNHIRDIDV